MKRKLKIKPTYECRCDGRLQTKRFTRLAHTGLVVELEHLKIKTTLTNEKSRARAFISFLNSQNENILNPNHHPSLANGTITKRLCNECN